MPLLPILLLESGVDFVEIFEIFAMLGSQFDETASSDRVQHLHIFNTHTDKLKQ